MSRVFTIWPADREGKRARRESAWRQERSWLVLDITDGINDPYVVEGPVTRQEALRRELEIRAVDRAATRRAS